MAENIPLVDFKDYSLDVDTVNIEEEKLLSLGEEIYKAFTQEGFCYLINHGIPQTKINDAFKVSKDFFGLPSITKKKYERSKEGFYGWIPTATEKVNVDAAKSDFKEAFNYYLSSDTQKTPTDVIPDFKCALDGVFTSCVKLCHRVLDVISLAMKLPTKNFLRDRHKNINMKGKNSSGLKAMYYPNISEDLTSKQEWCSEHSDFGTLTFLFQDQTGGLEVCNRNGKFIQAKPLEGTIVVNIGDLMQRWTADKLIATRHRVVMPKEETERRHGRQSLAFFIQPDDDTIVECLDNSQKYEPISAIDYLNMKMNAIY